MLDAAPLILGAYLWGGVPSAYLVGRYVKGIDIRSYGSGNVGASNVMVHVGKWTGLLLGAFDTVGKGTLPVVLANLAGQSQGVQVTVGLAAIAGHNWSPYLRFTGGRGVAAVIGVMLGLLMWKEMLAGVVIVGIVGRILTRETAFWTFIAVITLPALAYVFGRPAEIVYMSGGIALLLVLKRLAANWEDPRREDYSLPRVLAYRVLWDRDVPRSVKWTARNPSSEEEG